MKAHYAVLGIIGLLSAGCGAGTPQNEAIRTEAVLALGPLTTSSKVARQEVSDGVYELDMNRSEGAYTHFERAIAADPKFALAELYASSAAQAQKDAYDHLAKAVQLMNGASEIEKLQIQAAQKSQAGDDAGAAALYEQAAKKDPANARMWTNAAFVYNSAGDHEKSRALIDSAIAHGPEFEPAYIAETVEYGLSTPFDYKRSEAAARKAVALYPNESDPHDYMGDALRAQGKLQEAATEYTKCAELNPTRGGCLQQRGHVNNFLGKYAEARADYDASVALEKGNARAVLGAYRPLVSVYEGNLKSAVDEEEKWYESIDAMKIPEPIGVKVQVDSAIMSIAEEAGMIKEAERSVQRRAQLADQRAAELKSPQFDHQVALAKALDNGYLAVAKGDYAAATAAAQQYMQLRAAESNSKKDARAHDLMGMVAVKQQKWDEAVKHFAEGEPDHIYMNFYAAMAHEKLGHKDEALQLYTKVAHHYFANVGAALVRSRAIAKVKELGGTV